MGASMTKDRRECAVRLRSFVRAEEAPIAHVSHECGCRRERLVISHEFPARNRTPSSAGEGKHKKKNSPSRGRRARFLRIES